jgi:hypothetical protein
VKSSFKEKRKTESESITFRIEKNILEDLRQESEQKMESINILANQIFKSYVNWHKPANKAGLIYISKALFARAMDGLTDEQIVELADYMAKYHVKEEMHMLRREYTFSCFIDVLLSWLEVSGFHYRHDNVNNADIYVMHFDMGRKWSLFFGKFLQFVFEDLKLKNIEFEVTDNMIVFRIRQ